MLEENHDYYPTDEEVAALAAKLDRAHMAQNMAQQGVQVDVDAADGYEYDPVTGSIFGTARRSSVLESASPTSLGIKVEPMTVQDAGHKIKMPVEDQSIIVQAIQRCNVVDLLHLIKEIPIGDRQDFVNQHDSEGNPLILQAIYFEPSTVEMLTLLLDYGANPNLQNNKKNTAMHLACQMNHRRAIKTLITYDASVQVDNWEHLQPYQMVSDIKEEQAVMQNYVNTCFEKYEELILNKTIIKVSLPMRSYYRSVFDEMDLREKGFLDYIEIRLFLETLHPIGGIEPAPATGKQYFDWWNRSKDGKLVFPDYLHGITLYVQEEEKKKKKQLKMERIAKRRAAARAAAAAKQ